jgi:hypothetical protein
LGGDTLAHPYVKQTSHTTPSYSCIAMETHADGAAPPSSPKLAEAATQQDPQPQASASSKPPAATPSPAVSDDLVAYTAMLSDLKKCVEQKLRKQVPR